MGTSCASFVTDLFCHGEDFILCLLAIIKLMVLRRSNIISYLIELLNIYNPYFE